MNDDSAPLLNGNTSAELGGSARVLVVGASFAELMVKVTASVPPGF